MNGVMFSIGSTLKGQAGYGSKVSAKEGKGHYHTRLQLIWCLWAISFCRHALKLRSIGCLSTARNPDLLGSIRLFSELVCDISFLWYLIANI